MTQQQPTIIAVTGTKGKTTVVTALADIFRRMECGVLHVDTSGHFVNGVRRSHAADSFRIWGIKTVTAMPGKYLGDFLHEPALQKNPVAVLESSFSSHMTGLGYKSHKVGVFLNVFNDHINPDGPIKSRLDLAKAKSFIFSSIASHGSAVFNADDDMICKMLSKIPSERNVQLIPCGRDFAYFDLSRHLKNGGVAVTIQGNNVVLRQASGEKILCDLRMIPWTFNGTFEPSIMNVLHVCGAVYGYFDGALPPNFRLLIEATELPSEAGRLVVMKNENGVTVIGDYAHETQSLQAIAKLGKTFCEPGSKVVGVVRLSHERSEDDLRTTGCVIGAAFDEVVVYDKIDGHFRKPSRPLNKRYPQAVGRVSELVAEGARRHNTHVSRIIREDKALAYAAEIAQPGDVVVAILNDNVPRSLSFIEQSFKVVTQEVI